MGKWHIIIECSSERGRCPGFQRDGYPDDASTFPKGRAGAGGEREANIL